MIVSVLLFTLKVKNSMNAHVTKGRSLETEFRQIVGKQPRQDSRRLKRWFASVIDFLTGAQPISIREKTLKNGLSQWVVYEASSDTRRVFDTAQAVCIWLETGR